MHDENKQMKYAAGEIVERGKAMYEKQIRGRVEPGHLGQVLVINVDTGEYEIDRDHLAASDRAAFRFPGAALYAMRIGSPALGRLGLRMNWS